MSDDAVLRVCEIGRRGRLTTGEPWFEGGTPVVIDARGADELDDGELALLRVPAHGRATVVEPIGPATRIENVLAGLLLERGARWPGEGLSEAAEDARRVGVDPTDHAGRVDLRELPSLTIDPEDARDFDDAVSVQAEESGWRVWVHIADVSAYVRPGSALDRWAESRAFSTYVPGQVSPMLPEALSADACSLRPGKDRWCVTVEVALGADVSVLDASMYRSVIRSDLRLTYAEAEGLASGRSTAGAEHAIALVQAAARVSRALRERRFSRGAMSLQRPELAIQLDGDGGVESARWEAEPDAHALIEELMILANETVASLLDRSRAETLYRIHPEPDPQAILGLMERLAALDVPTPPEPEHLTPKSAASLVARITERISQHVRTRAGAEALTTLVLRSLEQASYHPENRGHSGLASRAYCHFTSPIRRYPDLVVHRALLAQLGVDDRPGEPDLVELGAHCSGRERELAAVEHEANDICLAWLLDRVLYEGGWEADFEGEVIGVIASGLFVRFGEVFEGYLPARALQDDYYELDELGVGLAGRRSGRRYRLGDRVVVCVDTLDRGDGRIKLAVSGKYDRR